MRAQDEDGREVHSVAEASISLQVATLIAASISAVGATITALTGVAKYKHESRSPALRVTWGPTGLTAIVSNASASQRTAYAIGFAHHTWWGSNIMVKRPVEHPNNHSDAAMPVTLAPGQQAAWTFTYQQLRGVQKCFPLLLRRDIHAYIDLGDKTYYRRLPSPVLQTLARTMSDPLITGSAEYQERWWSP